MSAGLGFLAGGIVGAVLAGANPFVAIGAFTLTRLTEAIPTLGPGPTAAVVGIGFSMMFIAEQEVGH